MTDTALVTVANVNRPPVLVYWLPDTTIGEGWSLDVVYAATDPDGAIPAFSLVSGPAGASLSASGTFSWTASYLQAGIQMVVVDVTDGLASVRDTAFVTVYNVNRLPSMFALFKPANNDTVKLQSPVAPIEFQWKKSLDLDTDDTLHYLIHIQGPGLDTSWSVRTDTSSIFDGMERLQSSSQYSWSVRVTDLIDTVNGGGTFAFRTSAGVTGIADLSSTVPEQFMLGQNYPNPFNPSTVIRYGLPVRSNVRLEIYDLLGKKVATVVDEEQDARFYEVRWEARVASGIYFSRIEAVGVDDPSQRFVKVRKMVLLR